MGLQRIQALVRIENAASIRVPEKNGYAKEGLLRCYPFGREFHDVFMPAVLADPVTKDKRQSAEQRDS